METGKRVRLCWCFLRVNAQTWLISKKVTVLLALQDLSLIRILTSAIGASPKSSSMKIQKTTFNLNVHLALQELSVDMKMSAFHVKEDEFIKIRINLPNVINVLLMLYAH